jgi:hypothetical protein
MNDTKNAASCPTCGATSIRFLDSVPRSAPIKQENARSWRVLMYDDELHYREAKDKRLICGQCRHEFPIPKNVVLDFDF